MAQYLGSVHLKTMDIYSQPPGSEERISQVPPSCSYKWIDQFKTVWMEQKDPF